MNSSRFGIPAVAAVLVLISACAIPSGPESVPQAPATSTTSVPASSPTTVQPDSSPTSTPRSDSSGWDDQEVPPASGAFPQTDRAGERIDTLGFLNLVVQHADQSIWVPYFATLGLQEPRVDVVYVGSTQDPTFSSNCDLNNNRAGGDDLVQPDSTNAWYCSTDGGTEWQGALILPLKTFENMWQGQILRSVSKRPGDFAAAVVVAHEFGHHVADELAKQTGVPEIAQTKSPELIADCFAGVWALGANSQGYLEPGDLEEGIEAMIALGVNGSSTHGTPAEREQAFRVGLNSQHLPYTCMKAYWPSMATYMEAR